MQTILTFPEKLTRPILGMRLASLLGFRKKRRSARPATSHQRSLILFGILLVTMVLLGVSATIVGMRRQMLLTAEQNCTNVATNLADDASRQILKVTAALSNVAQSIGPERLAAIENGSARTDPALHLTLFYGAGNLAALETLSIAGADGALLSSSRAWPAEQLNFADRDYFIFLRDHADQQFFTGTPVRSRQSGIWAFPIVRRIPTPDGRFAGVIIATVSITFFEEIYSAVARTSDLSILLRRLDGVLLASSPQSGEALGSMTAAPDMLGQLRAGAEEARTIGPDASDGAVRIHSLHKAKDVPLVLIVRQTEAAALAGWREQSIMLAIVAIGSALALAGLTLLLVRQAARRERSERALASTLENVAQGIIMIDGDGHIRVHNQRAVQLLDLPPDIMASQPHFDTVHEYQRQRGDFIAKPDGFDAARIRDLGQIGGGELSYERRCDNGLTLQVSIRSLREGGTVSTLSDITLLRSQAEELKRTEEARTQAAAAEEAYRLKGEFITIITHELRTPLNAIIGFSQMLGNELLGPLGHPEYSGYANSIQASGEQLLSTINAIIDFVQAEAGTLPLTPEEVDAGELLERMSAGLAAEAAHKGIEISLSLPTAPLIVVSDEAKLRRVLANILGNAMKFTAGGGRVEIAAVPVVGGVSITVADTGIGIAADQLSRVLSPFAQVDGHISRRYEGTGIGLPLAAKIVKRLGGTLTLDSIPGQGTTVQITLPDDLPRRQAA